MKCSKKYDSSKKKFMKFWIDGSYWEVLRGIEIYHGHRVRYITIAMTNYIYLILIGHGSTFENIIQCLNTDYPQ